MLCILVLNGSIFTLFVFVPSTWGQRQVQQWAQLEILAVWMQPVSVAHGASGSDSDTPIIQRTLPGPPLLMQPST